MAKPPLSDAQLKRRRKVQSEIGRTTSTMGLTGLGLLGASAVTRRKPAGLAAIKRLPGMHNVNPDKVRETAQNVGIAAGGIGGVGGFNQAKIYSEEARKKKPVVKAWSPVASNSTPEGRRQRRSQVYEGAAGGGSAVLAGGSYVRLGQAGASRRFAEKQGKLSAQNKSDFKATKAKRDRSRSPKNIAGLNRKANLHYTKAESQANRAGRYMRSARRLKGQSLKLAGASVGAAGLAAGIHHQRNKSWQEYGKSESFSKIGEWKTIDQRELSQRRSRKYMRGAGAVAGVSGGLTALGYHDSGDKKVYQRAGETLKHLNRIRRPLGSKGMNTKDAILPNIHGISNKRAAKAAVHSIGRSYGDLSHAGKIGTAGLAGAVAVGGAAKVGHTYQQHKINERRRHNFGKSAFGVDHGPSRQQLETKDRG